MSKTTVVLIALAIIVVFAFLYVSNMITVPIPGLSTEATYVGISFSSDVQTGSPRIANYTSYINVETYKTRVYVWQPEFRVVNSTRDCFKLKLGNYSVIVSFYKTMKISNNDTGEVYFYRVMNFTSGVDRKIEILIKQPIPENVTLRIDIHIEISVSIPALNYVWSKTIDRTIYTKSGSVFTTNGNRIYVTVYGRLVNTTIGILALEVKKYSWVNPSMDIASLDFNLYYLRHNGVPVHSPEEINLSSEALNQIIFVQGVLSKSDSQIWIDVERAGQYTAW